MNWKERAAEAWNHPGWREAACDYPRPRIDRVEFLRRLLDDSLSLERAWISIRDFKR
jgi:hypothetical protein